MTNPNKTTIELDTEMIDGIVRQQLLYWQNHHYKEATGTADWWVHPEDQERACHMYSAITKVLELYK